MPIFSTPTPIDLAIDLQVGAIEVIASDRADTVVSVSATNPAKSTDRRGVDETKVDFDGHRLTITGPRARLNWIGPNQNDSVDVTIELPTGSRLTAEISVGGVHATGALGATRVKNSMGSVELDTVGDLWVRAGHGNVALTRAEGAVEVTADHGQIRLGEVAGDAVVKASHGSIQIAETGGDVDAKLSYGDFDITRALASVTAKTAYGSVDVREVSRGSVDVQSGYGQVTIGVKPGVAAWLDLTSKDGHVRNELDGESAPDDSEQTVAVRARNRSGNITIRRAR
jgi:DUF4097 and DUF4098 domain-containing protein YvlB